MRDMETTINALNVSFGEADHAKEVYLQRDPFQKDIYGYFFCGDVTFFFHSKESIEALQNKLAQLKIKWLVEEQKEVPARA